MRPTVKGFTLIELMIVVAVIAILAAIAYPSYQEYVLRSRRVEGQALLNDAAARMERWRAQNGEYLKTAEDIKKLKLPSENKSENGYYTLSHVSDGSSYTLTATRALAQQADKKCGDFTLDSTGKKDLASGTPGTVAQCWK
ncbi:MAG: type IV pilin protein [Proteobacteria bacterium]|nr:type IV pilin protein [Pseudomonadota bacterium]